jgi:hypothetical protein
VKVTIAGVASARQRIVVDVQGLGARHDGPRLLHVDLELLVRDVVREFDVVLFQHDGRRVRDRLRKFISRLPIVLFGQCVQSREFPTLFCHRTRKSWFQVASSLFASANLLITQATRSCRLMSLLKTWLSSARSGFAS